VELSCVCVRIDRAELVAGGDCGEGGEDETHLLAAVPQQGGNTAD
jgi:hypothetical protein